MRSGPSVLLRRVIAVLALPAAIYVLLATGERAIDNYRLAQQAAELRQEIDQLKQDNVTLQAELKRRRTDAFVEETARAQLGLVREGDQAIVIIGAEPQVAPDRRNPTDGPASKSNPIAAGRAPWQQWLDFFFGE